MIAATTTGLVARNWLQMDRLARVMGVTSRGVFLLLESPAVSGSPLHLPVEEAKVLPPSPLGGGVGGEVVFLSTENHPGPLTVNIPGGEWLAGLGSHAQLCIAGQTILSADGRPIVDLRAANTWEAPPRPLTSLTATDRGALLDAVVTCLIPGGHPGLLERLEGFAPGLQSTRSSLVAGDAPALAAALLPHLGRGSGLTPGGDDIVLGLLLALNRWGSLLAPRLDVPVLNTILTSEARRRTTSLSVGLLACAAQGQADARLLTGLDGLVCGNTGPETICACFSTWGSSSGVHALSGMAVVLLG